MRNIRWDVGDTYTCMAFAFSCFLGPSTVAFLVVCICIDRYREAKRIICGLEPTKSWPVGIVISLAWTGGIICSLLEVRL